MTIKSRSSVATALAEYSLTMKDFAEWLDMTPEGLSRSIKRAEINGLSSKWQWCLYGFLMEKNGFSLNHRIFDD
jgi:hypothetical protein